MTTWLRPAVRLGAALLLPALVPFIIALFIWALPGDPASILCPPRLCGERTELLAARWHLDGGPWAFFLHWFAGALHGDFGMSWRLQQGIPVAELLGTSFPETLRLVLLAAFPLALGGLAAATRWLPAWVDPALRAVGLVPSVIFALAGAAVVTLTWGADAYGEAASRARLLLGAGALGLADAALASTVVGVRALFETERRQRYVDMGVLRGEGELANALPNVVPALAGQARARLLHLLSGAVIVEVVLQIDGMGDLLWRGTLGQDFGVVLAATFGFTLLASGLLLLQAIVEIGNLFAVRRAPAVRP